MLTCPPLLRTSTGRALPEGATEKPGAAPFQLTEVLLLAAGAVGTTGIEGVSVNATWGTVPPAVGQAPSPIRKKMNLPIWILKLSATAGVVRAGVLGDEVDEPVPAVLFVQ